MNEEKSSLDEKYVSHFKNVSLSVIPFQKKAVDHFLQLRYTPEFFWQQPLSYRLKQISFSTRYEIITNQIYKPTSVINKVGIVKIIPVLRYVPQEIFTPFVDRT